MKYSFDELPNRRNTASLKWDVKENELPLWVADMDFKTAPEVIEALKERVNIGAFGYSIVPNEYYESVKYWWETRHNFKIEKEWIVFATGVVASLSSIVRKMTTPAEKVLIQAPVYNIFYNSIYNNGRYFISSDLVYENGKYSIDWKDLENKLADKQCTLMILCNPHNPVGKIWTREELERIGALCYKHNVVVVSDEIHCDMLRNGRKYIPFASVNEINKNNSITLLAPSKTFNMAGLNSSCDVIPNRFLRAKVERGLNTDEVAEPNFFAISATIAAYNSGANWVDDLNKYIDNNVKYCLDFIKTNLDKAIVSPIEATYLLWVNVGAYEKDAEKLTDFIREKTGLFITPGNEYGDAGKSFVRINLATNLDTVKDAMNRLKTGIEMYQSLK